MNLCSYGNISLLYSDRPSQCDENKPDCKRCFAYGVHCSYSSGENDLQPAVRGVSHIEFSKGLPYWPNAREALFGRFQARTALSLAVGERLRFFQDGLVPLARSNPFLMHAILTLTQMHDRHSNLPLGAPLSQAEAYHWSQALAAFNRQLSQPPRPDQQIALWTTATLLGIIAFCHVDADVPEDSWPFRPSSSSDLDWLRMVEGKVAVWKLLRHLREDPAFDTLTVIHVDDILPKPCTYRGMCLSLSPDFRAILGIDEWSTSENNPYHSVAYDLSQASNPDCPPITTLLAFANFMGSMPRLFKNLLQQKDSRALLILLKWYVLIFNLGVFWLARRALLEGQSICLYLEKHHAHDYEIQSLLREPRELIYGRPRI